jgi:aldehyde dehydrogenase (NAD+)
VFVVIEEEIPEKTALERAFGEPWRLELERTYHPSQKPRRSAPLGDAPRTRCRDRHHSRGASASLPWAARNVDRDRAVRTDSPDDHRAVEANLDELKRLEMENVGKPVSIIDFEFDLTVDNLRFFAGAARTMETQGAGEYLEGYTSMLRREPVGVIGSVSPWNYPLMMAAWKVGPAIAAGCTVVLKTSEIAPLTGFIFAEMAVEAGLPAGVLNLVCGNGPEIGEAIVAHPLVDMVSLTGSVRAGQRVMQVAAEGIKRVHLELGGKSANIILEDADLPRAVAVGIEDAFRNAGQVCGGLTRMLVPRRRLAEAEEIAVAAAQAYVIGDPFDPATTLGPVKTAAQRDRVRAYIRGGIEDGVRLLTGGAEAPAGLTRGYFVRPTLFSGSNATRIAREEVFGPVVTIIPFDNEEDALTIANDSPYGLAGAIWSADAAHARALAQRLRTGRIRINGAAREVAGDTAGRKPAKAVKRANIRAEVMAKAPHMRASKTTTGGGFDLELDKPQDELDNDFTRRSAA